MTRLLTNISNNDPLMIPDKRAEIDQIIDENKPLSGALMVVLNELQNQIGHISPPMQAYVAKQMNVPIGSVHGVVTFYSFFTTKPRGRHSIKFCLGTACYVSGTVQLIEKAKQLTGIDIGDTTEDGAISLEVCRCVGACSQAPVVVVDEKLEKRVRADKFPKIIRKCQK